MKNVYCDISATTPVATEVLDLMQDVQRRIFGNPSSIHKYGQEAHAVIERARLQVAYGLNCDPGEIIFTGGGSESNNLALQGWLNPGDHIITSTFEHPAVINVIKGLSKKGITSTFISPEQSGSISPDDVNSAITEQTRMISIMAVNNELGTVNPIIEIGEIANRNAIPFHTDAVQMLGKLPIDLENLHIDLMSMSAHKLYGPKGVGALYIRTGVKLPPTLFGGGQENNLRPGTENIAGIAGFGLAVELATNEFAKKSTHVNDLESLFIQKLKENCISYTINGKARVPGILNISFHGTNAQSLLMNLDMAGVAISAGSACASGTIKPSPILLEIGLSEKIAQETVRISFGKIHTEADINYVSEQILKITKRLNNIAEIRV